MRVVLALRVMPVLRVVLVQVLLLVLVMRVLAMRVVLMVMARPRRFERPTPAFGGQYSIQLSYGRPAQSWNRVASRQVMPTGGREG